jgi:Na+/H+-dicarboxylate symporter
LVNIIAPGSLTDETQRIKNRMEYEVWVQQTSGVEQPKDGKSYLTDPAYKDLASEAADPATIEKIQAEREGMVSSQMQTAEANEGAGPLQFLVDMVPENLVLSISNNGLMLQVIFFAIFFGITLIMIPSEQSAPVIAFINGTNEVFLKMVDLVMKAAPFFVFALLAGVIARMADTPAQVFEIFKGLGFYSLTVMIGLLFMIFIFYPVIATLFIRKLTYREFFKNISPAQFLAFSTSSSAATLPVTMECVEENMGVSKNVASFVLPIGATVNMDGTSLYQAVAVIFLAQLHLVDLTFSQQLTC